MTGWASTAIRAPRPDAASDWRGCRSGRGSSAAPAGSTAAEAAAPPSAWLCRSAREVTMAPVTEPAIRLLVVDDHLMVREGLRSMLGGEEIEIVGEASTGGEAVRIAADLSPEVVLLDLELPDMDGLTVLRQLKEIAPTLPVLVVTMHDDPALVRRAVRNGESVLDPGLLRAVVDGDAAPARMAPPLSRVELDLLRLVADGLTNR